MKLGIGAVGFGPKVSIDLDRIRHAESLGYDSAWTAEAYGNDAVTTATWVLANTTKNYQNPTAPHIPLLAPNDAAELFEILERFRFRDGGAFDFRGEPERSAGEAGLLSNSNERDGWAYRTTFRLGLLVQTLMFALPAYIIYADPYDLAGANELGLRIVRWTIPAVFVLCTLILVFVYRRRGQRLVVWHFATLLLLPIAGFGAFLDWTTTSQLLVFTYAPLFAHEGLVRSILGAAQPGSARLEPYQES